MHDLAWILPNDQQRACRRHRGENGKIPADPGKWIRNVRGVIGGHHVMGTDAWKSGSYSSALHRGILASDGREAASRQTVLSRIIRSVDDCECEEDANQPCNAQVLYIFSLLDWPIRISLCQSRCWQSMQMHSRSGLVKASTSPTTTAGIMIQMTMMAPSFDRIIHVHESSVSPNISGSRSSRVWHYVIIIRISSHLGHQSKACCQKRDVSDPPPALAPRET